MGYYIHDIMYTQMPTGFDLWAFQTVDNVLGFENSVLKLTPAVRPSVPCSRVM